MTKVIKLLLLLSSLWVMVGCGEIQTAAIKNAHSFVARITYYTKHEDKFGCHIACSKHRRAQQNRTCAASSKYPFGTPVYIAGLKGKVGNGNFVVEDRGTALERQKASYGTTDVFDVYLDMSNKQMRRFASTMPPYLPVVVGTPQPQNN